MKHFLSLIILITTGIYSQAQTDSFPRKAGRVYYEIVDSSFRGITKGQLYSMSKLWLFDQFRDANNYLQLDVPEGGLIAGRITLPTTIGFTWKGTYACSCSFAVIAKDGRYKAQLYDFWLTATFGGDSLAIEQVLARPNKYEDYKKTFPKLEVEAYGFIRSIALAMQSVYDVMDF